MAVVSPEVQQSRSSPTSDHGNDSQDSGIMANALKPLPDSQDVVGHKDSQTATDSTAESLGVPRHGGFSRPEVSLDSEDLSAGFTFGPPVQIVPGQFTGQAVRKRPEPQFSDGQAVLLEQGVAGGENHASGELNRKHMDEMSSHDSPRPTAPIKPTKTSPIPNHSNGSSLSLTKDCSAVIMSPPMTRGPKALEKPFVDYEPIPRPPGPAPSKKRISPQVRPHRDSSLPTEPESVVPKSLKNTGRATSNRQDHKQPSGLKHKRSHVDQDTPSLHNENRSSFRSQGYLHSETSSFRFKHDHHQRQQSRRDQHAGMTRPVRRETVKKNVTTPGSERRRTVYTSNTSRKATPSQVSSTPRQPPAFSPLRKFKSFAAARQRSREKSRLNTIGRYAEVLNQIMNEDREHDALDIHGEEQQIQNTVDDLEHCIAQYAADAKASNKEAQQLSNQCDMLKQQLEDKSSELESRSSGVEQLEAKCRQYKGFLNDAVKELQELYMTSKENLNNAVDKLRAEQLKNAALDQQQKAKTEAAQELMRQRIANAISESKRLELDFREKLGGLEQQLEDRNADLGREKETIKTLLQRLAEQQACQDQLKDIQGQTSAISMKLVDLETKQKEQDAARGDAQANTLALIVERLDTLAKEVKLQPQLFSEWTLGNDQTTSSIRTQIENVATAQSQTSDNTHQLAQQLDNHMKDVWKCLNESQKSLSHEIEEKSMENMLLSTFVEEKEGEIEDLSLKLNEMTDHALQGEAQLQELEEKISELENAPKDDPATLRRIQVLEEDKNKLKIELASKSSIASVLQTRLQQKDQELADELEKHKEEALEFARVLQERETATQTAQDQAVTAAVQEASSTMEKAKQDFQRLVDKAESNRDNLAKQLDDAKHLVSEMRDKDCRDTEIMHNLRSDLAGAEQKVLSLVENEKQRLTDIEVVEKRNESTITQLKRDLTQAEQNLARLTEDSQAYDREAQSSLDDLKQWAQGVHGFGKLRRQLQDKDDKLDRDVKSRKLRELKLMHEAIIYHYGRRKGNSKLVQASVQPQTETREILDQDGAAPTFQVSAEHMACEEITPSGSLPHAELIDHDKLDRARRVILRTPVGDMASPVPLSVSQEKERRREGGRPKGIMRMRDDIHVVEEDLERRRLLQMSGTPGSGIFGRGIQSQMVTDTGSGSGKAAGTNGKKTFTLANRAWSKETDNPVSTNAEDIDQLPQQSRKRTKSAPTGQKKKAKIADQASADATLVRQSILAADSQPVTRQLRGRSIVERSLTMGASATKTGTSQMDKTIKLSESQESMLDEVDRGKTPNSPAQSRTSSFKTYSLKDSAQASRTLGSNPFLSDPHRRRSTDIVEDSQELNVPH